MNTTDVFVKIVLTIIFYETIYITFFFYSDIK